MGERLNISNSNVEFKEVEPVDRYDSAVAETLAEYEDKTSFEKKVMTDIVIKERATRDCILQEERRLNRALSIEEIKKTFEHDFNDNMNCGGFALELFSCFFTHTESLEESVKLLLEECPFVRLQDGNALSEDEYRVFYRHQEGGLAHHFIKEENGKLIEKNGNGPVRDFEEWPDALKGAPEVTLIVNRNHDIRMVDEDGFYKGTFSI
jgi:hypothetical protein